MRAEEIVAALVDAGLRATTDPSALNPPGVLIPAPTRVYDVGCGYTVQWRLYCIGVGPTGGDHTTWAELDDMADTVASLFPIARVDPEPYARPGLTQYTSSPTYLVTFEETL